MKRLTLVSICMVIGVPSSFPAYGDVPARAKMEVQTAVGTGLLSVRRARVRMLVEDDTGEWYRLLMSRKAKRAGVRKRYALASLESSSLGGIEPSQPFVDRVAGRTIRAQYRARNRAVEGPDPEAAALQRLRLRTVALHRYRVRTDPAPRLNGDRMRVELALATGSWRKGTITDATTGTYRLTGVPVRVYRAANSRTQEARMRGRVAIDVTPGDPQAVSLAQFELNLDTPLTSPTGTIVTQIQLGLDPLGGSVTPGDSDADGDVDADDYAAFQACYTGPGHGPITPDCLAADMDDDNDVDGYDWDAFLAAWSGTTPAPTAIPPGIVCLQTTAGSTWTVFGGASGIPPIPAGFFFPGSLPWEGTIPLRGEPLPDYAGAADTVIERTDWADLSTGATNVPVELVALSLRSVQPITVLGGPEPRFYDVRVTLNPTQPSLGSMVIEETVAGVGGEYALSAGSGSGIHVYARFNFLEAWPAGATSAKATGVVPLVLDPVDPVLIENDAALGPLTWQYAEPPLVCEPAGHFYPVPGQERRMLLGGGLDGQHGANELRATEGCCLPDGTCADLAPNDCTGWGGTPQGQPCGGTEEACCLPGGSCAAIDPVCCGSRGGTAHGPGSVCRGDAGGNGVDDLCETIPAVTEWGLIVLMLLLVSAATVVIARRAQAPR